MIPVTVLGGWLGAGKTTLVNHVLRHAEGRRIAVLVNDFGSLGIDAELIVGAAGPVLELAGGCVCCSFGADLVGTLRQVCARTPPPDALLIETSGVALPASVARTVALVRGLAVDGIVVVADAETLRQRAADRYVGDTVRQQLAEAELLLLNKADLVDDAALAALQVWAAGAAAHARVVCVAHGAAPVTAVLGLPEPQPQPQAEPEPVPPPARAPRPLRGGGEVSSAFVDASRSFPGPVDVAALARSLSAPQSGIVRAKGLLTDLDGRRVLLQVVGQRAQISPAAGDPAAPGRLAVVGLRGLYDRPRPT